MRDRKLPMTDRRFGLLCVVVLLVALGLREWFVLTAYFPEPTQGDVSAYLRYALHLVWDGTFSSSGDVHPVPPDAYRGPGYPLLLAAIFRVTGQEAWYPAIYQVQVVLGVATVACVIALAREWLAREWALIAGLWLAFQPHHIAATGAMLTEVLFGLCIVGALLCAALALRRRSLPLSLLAGAVFGYGYLVNPVLALFPFLLVPLFWRAGLLRNGAVVVLVSLLAVGGWSLRNASVGASSDQRALENFVQGSWPDYHQAVHLYMFFPHERAVMAGIKHETQAIRSDRANGLRMVGNRLAGDPAGYARWYVLNKPYLLWDWSIRMGKGGTYTVDVERSPMEQWPLMGPVIVQWALNPVVFAFALAGVLVALRAKPAAAMVALCFVYVTAVHVVFQAEPRYAIAYRPLEILLALSGALWLFGIRQRIRARWFPTTIPATPAPCP